jgi:hypothetical protein
MQKFVYDCATGCSRGVGAGTELALGEVLQPFDFGLSEKCTPRFAFSSIVRCRSSWSMPVTDSPL